MNRLSFPAMIIHVPSIPTHESIGFWTDALSRLREGHANRRSALRLQSMHQCCACVSK